MSKNVKHCEQKIWEFIVRLLNMRILVSIQDTFSMEGIPKVIVAVTGHDYTTSEDDETRSWSIKFIIKVGSIITQFISHEPYQLKLSAWQQLIRGDNCILDMYMGNGEGHIKCSDRVITFTSNTSGAGGDTDMTCSIPHELMQEQLTTAIEFAVEYGYEFA